MPRQEVLERIETVEREAGDIVEGTGAERGELVAEAYKRADEVHFEAEKEAAGFELECLQEERTDIEAEWECILEGGEDVRDELVAKAGDHIDDAVEFTTGKLEGAVDVQT